MTIVEIIKKLESTTKRNEKIRILEENKDNNILKQVLKLTYDQAYQYYIVKVPKVECGSKDFESMFPKITELLSSLNARHISGNNAIDRAQKILRKLNCDSQNIFMQMLKRKFTKAGINVKTINKVWPKLIPEFDVQLANTYDVEKRDKYPKKFVATPKLDGIRCFYVPGNGLYTRNGKRIYIFSEIENEADSICKQNNFEFLDGELWTSDFDFNTVQSAVMSNKNVKSYASKINYNVFACGGEFKNSEEMMNSLDLVTQTSKRIKSLKWWIIENDLEMITKKTLQMIEKGFEGLMLRNYEVPYVFKRDDNLLKVKGFQLLEISPYVNNELQYKIKELVPHIELDDFFITQVLEGEGNFSGMIGSLVIEGIVNNQKIKTKVGSGFLLDERKDLWKIRDQLIGKEVTILCQEVTKDNSLRFPVIKNIKLDR